MKAIVLSFALAVSAAGCVSNSSRLVWEIVPPYKSDVIAAIGKADKRAEQILSEFRNGKPPPKHPERYKIKDYSKTVYHNRQFTLPAIQVHYKREPSSVEWLAPLTATPQPEVQFPDDLILLVFPDTDETRVLIAK